MRGVIRRVFTGILLVLKVLVVLVASILLGVGIWVFMDLVM